MLFKLKLYWNVFVVFWRALFLVKDCTSILGRKNLLTKNRQKHVIVAVESRLRKEGQNPDRGYTVSRQDVIMYLLAKAFSNTELEAAREEMVDIIAILAVCAAEPLESSAEKLEEISVDKE